MAANMAVSTALAFNYGLDVKLVQREKEAY